MEVQDKKNFVKICLFLDGYIIYIFFEVCVVYVIDNFWIGSVKDIYFFLGMVLVLVEVV